MSLLPVEEAVSRIVGDVRPLDVEEVPLECAADRILAHELVARRTQPPFPASAMDGYAVRSGDAVRGAHLAVIGMSAAGRRFDGEVSAGEAVRIFTGAPVPPGADTILIQENVKRLDETKVVVSEPPEPGRHIRAVGLDFKAGERVLRQATRLGARELSLAAAMGHRTVPVRRRPRVAIIATGNELVPPGQETGPDQIVSSNAVGIAAMARHAGGDPHDLGIALDDRDDIASAIARASALPADILVTLGGASVGDHDLVREALSASGMTLDFWRIAMRPGKPLMFGYLSDRRVLGLPGNPVSAFVCGLLFLRPLIGALLGLSTSDLSEPAVLGVNVEANDRRQDYVRATLRETGEGHPVAAPLPVQDSAMLSTLALADCLLIRPPNAPAGRAGDPCRIIRLR